MKNVAAVSFKARLIQDLSYYKYSILFLGFILLLMFVDDLVNIMDVISFSFLPDFDTTLTMFLFGEDLSWEEKLMSNSFIELLCILFFLVIIVAVKKRLLGKYESGPKLEIKSNEITIHDKSGEVQKKISIEKDDKIFVNHYFSEKSISGKLYEIYFLGKDHKNYLILDKGDFSERFDFIIDSHYMLAQLEKLISDWDAKGMLLSKQKVSALNSSYR